MHTTNENTPGPANPQSDAYEHARRRVGQLRGFYSNLFVYVVVIAFLAVLNLVTDRSYLWFLWAAAGWGLGVALHAYWTFANHGVLGRDWEERKIREIMEREQRR
jgi:hypothetical protein